MFCVEALQNTYQQILIAINPNPEGNRKILPSLFKQFQKFRACSPQGRDPLWEIFPCGLMIAPKRTGLEPLLLFCKMFVRDRLGAYCWSAKAAISRFHAGVAWRAVVRQTASRNHARIQIIFKIQPELCPMCKLRGFDFKSRWDPAAVPIGCDASLTLRLCVGFRHGGVSLFTQEGEAKPSVPHRHSSTLLAFLECLRLLKPA